MEGKGPYLPALPTQWRIEAGEQAAREGQSGGTLEEGSPSEDEGAAWGPGGFPDGSFPSAVLGWHMLPHQLQGPFLFPFWPGLPLPDPSRVHLRPPLQTCQPEEAPPGLAWLSGCVWHTEGAPGATTCICHDVVLPQTLPSESGASKTMSSCPPQHPPNHSTFLLPNSPLLTPSC